MTQTINKDREHNRQRPQKAVIDMLPHLKKLHGALCLSLVPSNTSSKFEMMFTPITSDIPELASFGLFLVDTKVTTKIGFKYPS